MAACARRETLEQTGVTVEPGRIAFVLEVQGPDDPRRTVDLVFLAALAAHAEHGPAAEGPEASFVRLSALPRLTMRPPVAGYLRGLHSRSLRRTAAYLGNLWRPEDGSQSPAVPEPAEAGARR